MTELTVPEYFFYLILRLTNVFDFEGIFLRTNCFGTEIDQRSEFFGDATGLNDLAYADDYGAGRADRYFFQGSSSDVLHRGSAHLLSPLLHLLRSQVGMLELTHGSPSRLRGVIYNDRERVTG